MEALVEDHKHYGSFLIGKFSLYIIETGQLMGCYCPVYVNVKYLMNLCHKGIRKAAILCQSVHILHPTVWVSVNRSLLSLMHLMYGYDR